MAIDMRKIQEMDPANRQAPMQGQAQPQMQMPMQGQPPMQMPMQEDPMANMPTSAVRDGSEQEAFIKGQRMGAQQTARQAGTGFGGEDPDHQRGMTKERLQKAMRTLNKYKSGKASVDRRIISAQNWWKLNNWQQIEHEKGVKGATERKSSTGWLWNSIVGKHADAMASFPEPVILPRMEDDKPEAKKLSDIVPVVMALNDFEKTYSDCTWQKMQEGTGAYGVFWDPTKLNGMGDINIRKINLLNLFWEPGINDIQESKNVFYVSLEDNEKLEQMHPELVGKLKHKSIVVAKYRYDDSVDTTDMSVVVDWYYFRYDNGKKELHYCKFVGENVLYSTEEKGQPLYDDAEYPFVLDPLYPIEGSPTGYGLIDICKDSQMDLDVLNQAMVLNCAAAATPRFFTRKDGGVNEDEFADWSKPFVHVNGNLGDDSIRPVVVNEINGNIMNMLQQKIDEVKFISGNVDVANGSTPSGVTSASGIAALQEASGRTSADSTKAAYRAYKSIVIMVIERIRQFYDIPRTFRILGDRGEEQFTQFSNAGITPQPMMGGMGLQDGYRLPVFDIDVRAQKETAYTKMSQNELALQFFNMGFFNPELTDQVLMALDMMDFKGKDELLQKVQQNGTIQDTFMQVLQIALSLAQKYDPAIADQLMMVGQQMLGDQMGAMPVPDGGQAPKMGGNDLRDTASNPYLNKARARTADTISPD